MFELLAALSLAAWLYLVFAHGRFWLGDQRLDGRAPAPARWPDVVAVVPARDEADLVPRTVRALLDQEYAGRLRIVLVDDESADGTGDAARDTAKGHPNGARLEVVRTAERPSGWVGKMWAVESGVRAAERSAEGAPEWWWLSDADVLQAPDSLARLVAKGEAEKLDLQLLRREADGAEDAEAAHPADRRDHVAAVAEREDRQVDPEHLTHARLHDVATSLAQR